LATGLLSCGLFCQQSQADPIQGNIDFGGVVTYDTMSLATATRVNVWNSSNVSSSSGDFSTFTFNGEAVTMGAPWIFNPSTPKLGLWSVGGFTFDLLGSVVVSQSATFLNITGTGIVSGNGFDPTPGDWSVISRNSNGQPKATFGFQTNPTAVPDGGTTGALLGLAFVGLEGLRRKLRAV
jgi:hypothetical protein